MRDIESELVRFTDELDSLLLRVDLCDSERQGVAGNEVNEGASIATDAAYRGQDSLSLPQKYLTIGSKD